MTRSLTLLACVLLVAPAAGADTDLLFPAGDTPARLRVEPLGPSPEVAWAAFLDKLFAHFDRDGDGFLSEAEAKRVFPLPLPEGREVAPDFAALDADRAGKVTPAQFRAFYRARGFTPLTVIARSAPADALALGDALFRHLDRDGDGQLSADELRRAPALLKKLDEDEDEVLTAAELLGANPAAPAAKPVGLKAAPPGKYTPDAILRLEPGGKPALHDAGAAFGLRGLRLTVPGGVCALDTAADDPATGFRAAAGFYRAQFKAAVGDKPAAKSVFADDPTAQVLTGLFDAADRDGDGKLTRAELEAFFDLIERGVGCRVVVTATDRGRNLFDLVDANGDGKLDLAELTRAGRELPAELAREKPLARAAVPASYRLAVSRGPVGESFGPVPFGGAAKPKPPAKAAARGPKWFRAMDANGDGFLSAHEFVGPPELFAKLDADGDGRISAAEAEAAKP